MNESKTMLGRKILSIKHMRGLTWSEIGAAVGYSPVWICTACLGQMAMDAATADKIATMFDLDKAEKEILKKIPHRGCGSVIPPTDPLIYRFYELLLVYGQTWKELIGEEFGDGIMSAIDFDMSLERQQDPQGDRVRIVLNGKFLPYKTY